MDVLNIDWKNIDSRFVRDEFYENIRAPKWLDFLALEEPVDDDAWFCKPDCNHPKTAASLLDAPLFESPKVKQPRSVRSTLAASVSSSTPLGDRSASLQNCKKTRGPLSTSVTSLYELKTRENTSLNSKKPSPADRNKHAFRPGKYLADAENDNPNRTRSVSGISSMGKNPKSFTPSNIGKSAKLQGSNNVSISPAKLSRQYTAANDSQSPLSMEKKGYEKQAIGKLSTASNITPVTTPASSEKKGTKKQTDYSTTTPVKTPESSEKKGVRSAGSNEKRGVSSCESSEKKEVRSSQSSEKRGVTPVKTPESSEKKGVRSSQNSGKKGVSSCESSEKKGVRSSQSSEKKWVTPVKTPESSEKKGVRSSGSSEKKAVSSCESSEKKGVRSSQSSEKKGVRSSSGTTKLKSNKSLTSGNKSSSLKSGSAITSTFSAGNLFGKTPRKDFLTHLSEFCSEVKKLALYGGQKDSAKHANMAFNHDSNIGSEEKGKQIQDDKVECSYEFSSERSSSSGSNDRRVLKNSIIDDPDKHSKSGPMEIGGLRLRNSKKDVAKSCPKSGVKDNLSPSKQSNLNEEYFSSHTKNIVSDTSVNTVTSLSILHEHDSDDKYSSDPFLESFSEPIHAHELENTAQSITIDPPLQKYKESSEHLEKGSMEPQKKSFHAKIFNPSSWKRKKTDGVEQRVQNTNKYSWNAGQKVQSCPPSPQQVSRFSQASSSSSQGRKSATPTQPFRFRTSERGALRDYRKLQRSSSCADNGLVPEPKLYMPDMFWFLKKCA